MHKSGQKTVLLRILFVVGSVFSFAILLLVDQFSKYWAVTHLKNQPPLRFLNDWLELYYLENHGAAWGILTGKTIFLIVVTAIVLLVLFVIYFRLPIIKQHRLMRAALMLIASGAVGNLLDRILHQYVIDFIYVKVIDFPVFNVADIYVTIGAFLFAVIVLFTKEEAENGE